jgi:hypothetical protein
MGQKRCQQQADRIIAEHIEPLRAERDEAVKRAQEDATVKRILEMPDYEVLKGVPKSEIDAMKWVAESAIWKSRALKAEAERDEARLWQRREAALASDAFVMAEEHAKEYEAEIAALEALLAECAEQVLKPISESAGIWPPTRKDASALLAKLKARKEPQP